MKKILFILTLMGLVFLSCDNKKKLGYSGTHVLEDGTMHTNNTHYHVNASKPDQESFEVKANNHAEYKHDHEDVDHEGHEHGEAGHDNGEHK